MKAETIVPGGERLARDENRPCGAVAEDCDGRVDAGRRSMGDGWIALIGGREHQHSIGADDAITMTGRG